MTGLAGAALRANADADILMQPSTYLASNLDPLGPSVIAHLGDAPRRC